MLYKKCLLLFSSIIAFNVNANCIRDVSSAGLTMNATKFDFKGAAELSSPYGIGLRYGKLIYCPEREIEFFPSIRARSIKFVDIDRPELSAIKKRYLLLALGTEIKKIVSQRLELVGDIELRQDLEASREQVTNKVSTGKFYNFKLLAGPRYFLVNEDKVDWSLKGMFGALVPITEMGRNQIGNIWHFSNEFFFKIGSRSALSFNVFYEKSLQRVSKEQVIGSDVGLVTSLVFRW